MTAVVDSAIGNGNEPAIAESSPNAGVGAGAREDSVTRTAVLVWLRHEFQPPEIWPEIRPVWAWARWGEQCPPACFARGLSRMYAALVALPLTTILVWGKWIVARPTRLVVFAVLYLLASAALPGLHLPRPW